MIPLSLAVVAHATGGRLDAVDSTAADGRVVTGVAIDSRALPPAALFVALPGERTDGHDHAGAAVAAGAVGVLAARPVGVPAVVVDDVVAALGRLATAVLDRLPELVVVGLTGSSGKTSTKDLLAQVLTPLGPVVAPPGSYNNDIGLPLTVLSADPGTRVLVLEYGARGAGHIRTLCEVARPDVAVVLNVGSAHLGEFGSHEAIAAAKGELVEALRGGGRRPPVAVLSADDALVDGMAARTDARVVRFGESSGADVRAEDVDVDERGRAAFTLVGAAGSARVRLLAVGEHQVANALAAAAVALELGLAPDVVASGLSAATSRSKWRMEVVERADGVTVVNDAYNANPESVRAALRALQTMSRGRRSWAVLGEMAELGERAPEEHDAVGRLVVRLDVSRLVTVGDPAGPVGRLHAGAVLEGSWGRESVHVRDVGAAVELLRAELRPGDVVLVKASRSVGLDRVATALLADVRGDAPAAAGAGAA